MTRWLGHLRTLPDFLVIGAEKCGTTSLYRHLIRHPRVVHASTKEPHFFDYHWEEGPVWYRAHFPLTVRRTVARLVGGAELRTGEASPDYVFHPHAAARVRELLPQAMLIVLLRNPIDRAFSHYNQQVRKLRETLSFEAAIAAEPARVDEELGRLVADARHPVHAHVTRFSYLARGRYAEQLERWLACFDRRQLLVVQSEALFADPETQLRRAHAFLELTGGADAPAVARFRNENPGLYAASIHPDTRRRLAEYFAPHNRRLNALLGTDLGWDAPTPRPHRRRQDHAA